MSHPPGSSTVSPHPPPGGWNQEMTIEAIRTRIQLMSRSQHGRSAMPRGPRKHDGSSNVGRLLFAPSLLQSMAIPNQDKSEVLLMETPSTPHTCFVMESAAHAYYSAHWASFVVGTDTDDRLLDPFLLHTFVCKVESFQVLLKCRGQAPADAMFVKIVEICHRQTRGRSD
jgi:hypothetical protein